MTFFIKKIAVIIDDLFEDSEYFQPVNAFRDAGHMIINIGLQKEKIVKSKKHAKTVTIEESLKDITVHDFDALLIPGGYSPDKLRAHDEAVCFVKDFFQSKKPVFSICHGPQLLISADVIKNKNITGWKSIKQDIINAGGKFSDVEVIEDDNLISSRSPKDLDIFIETCLKKLKK